MTKSKKLELIEQAAEQALREQVRTLHPDLPEEQLEAVVQEMMGEQKAFKVLDT